LAKIKDIKSREGGRHWRAKALLFDFITDDSCKFLGGTGLFDVSKVRWDYASMEAFAFNNDPNIPINYLPNFSTESYKSTEEYVKLTTKLFHERYDDNKSEYNRNICIKDGNKEAFYNDPLNYCKYSRETDVRFIFDIALGRKGVYTTVIEIVDKAPVKRDKKVFCEKWGLDLITVKCDDVLKSNLIARHFKADIKINEINYEVLAKELEVAS